MRRTRELYAALAMFIVVYGSSTVVLADEQHYRLRGKVASAYVGTSDGCVITDVVVYAAENTQKVEPGAPKKANSTEVMFLTQNVCAGFSYKVGTVLVDNSVLFEPNVTGASISLTSQTMALSTCVYDSGFVVCTPDGTTVVSAALSFTSTSSADRTTYIYNTRTQGFTSKFRSTGNVRSASVVGSVTVGNVPYSFDGVTGTLMANATSELILSH